MTGNWLHSGDVTQWWQAGDTCGRPLGCAMCPSTSTKLPAKSAKLNPLPSNSTLINTGIGVKKPHADTGMSHKPQTWRKQQALEKSRLGITTMASSLRCLSNKDMENLTLYLLSRNIVRVLALGEQRCGAVWLLSMVVPTEPQLDPRLPSPICEVRACWFHQQGHFSTSA